MVSFLHLLRMTFWPYSQVELSSSSPHLYRPFQWFLSDWLQLWQEWVRWPPNWHLLVKRINWKSSQLNRWDKTKKRIREVFFTHTHRCENRSHQAPWVRTPMGLSSSSITHPTHVIYAFSQSNLNGRKAQVQFTEFQILRHSCQLTVLAFIPTRIDRTLVNASAYSITLQGWRYLSILGIPERCSIDLINNVTRADKLVHVSLTSRRQVKDEDASTEIPEWQTGQWCSRLYRSIY